MKDMDSENFFLRDQKSRWKLSFVPVFVLMICLIIGSCNAEMSAYNWNNLGTTYYNQGDYPNAINAFLNAINLNPNLIIAWNNLGIAYQANNQYYEAQKAFQHAISLNNGFYEGWSNLAYMYQYQGRIDDYNYAIKHVQPGFTHQGLYFNNFQNGNYNSGNFYNGVDTNHGPDYPYDHDSHWNNPNLWDSGRYNSYNPNFPGYHR